jgi:hypothetical protein
VVQDDKKSKVAKETLDLAAFAKEGLQTTQNVALGKKNPPVLMVRAPACTSNACVQSLRTVHGALVVQ